MKSLHLRKIGDNLMQRLKQSAHELDPLMGTWNKEDLKEFQKNAGAFEKIDEDLWK